MSHFLQLTFYNIINYGYYIRKHKLVNPFDNSSDNKICSLLVKFDTI